MFPRNSIFLHYCGTSLKLSSIRSQKYPTLLVPSGRHVQILMVTIHPSHHTSGAAFWLFPKPVEHQIPNPWCENMWKPKVCHREHLLTITEVAQFRFRTRNHTEISTCLLALLSQSQHDTSHQHPAAALTALPGAFIHDGLPDFQLSIGGQCDIETASCKGHHHRLGKRRGWRRWWASGKWMKMGDIELYPSLYKFRTWN